MKTETSAGRDRMDTPAYGKPIPTKNCIALSLKNLLRHAKVFAHIKNELEI